jgi:hypothetical protein
MPNWIKTAVLGLIAVAGFSTATFLASAETTDDKQIIDAQKKTYPLTTCVVSNEKLETTSMGAPIDYLYKSKDKDGKETVRLVRFCCKSCVRKFTKDPQKYLEKIDAAAAASKTPAPATSSH